jgi:methyl-accepting chemotaxis protein
MPWRRLLSRVSVRPGSLRAKILLYSGITVSLLLLVVILDFSFGMLKARLAASKENIGVNVTKAALEIERNNTIAVTLVKTMALNQENALFGKREETVRLLFRVAQEFPQFFDSYVIYEPNADGQDHLNKGARGSEPGGRFNATVNNVDGKQVLVLGVDMESSLYYQGVKDRLASGAKERYMITEPYIYQGVMMLEHTYPIVINGRFAGVTGADRTLTYLTDYLSHLKPYLSADFILLSRLGNVICATMDPALNTRKLQDTPYRDVLGPFFQSRGGSELVEHKDPRNGKVYIYAAAPVALGNWTVVMRVSEDEIRGPITAVMDRVLLLAFAGFLITLLVLGWISRSITEPIRAAVSAAERVAAGELDFQVVASGTDETGLLLAAIQKMTRSLNSLIGQVQRSGLQVTTSTTEIAASARQLEVTMARQAASTDRASAKSGEISQQALQLLQTMTEVASFGSHTADLASSGRTGLVSMQRRMEDLVGATAGISGRLSAISEKAGNISEVIATITRVADQTNLLSLNAAIEAEKAGDAGRGFSVVASEIRHLADQTAVATLDIEQTVIEMQAAVAEGVHDTSSFSSEVGACVEDIAQVVEELEAIISQVQALTPRFEAVNGSMQAQADAARQISGIMTQLSQGAQHTSASVAEFNKATQQLHEAASALRDEVSRFRV